MILLEAVNARIMKVFVSLALDTHNLSFIDA